MSKKHVHIISHTHWDREWYLPYEKHHVRLVQLMDELLGLLDRDPDFRSFHLDGQTIVLEDYLQVRPETRDKLIRYVREGRLLIGPWYILQDEFLTSSEANIRNLLVGHRDAREFGPVVKIGYFPDSFGNMGQAPQILKQAGMEAAVFGRGVKPTGFNNSVADAAHYESPYSEMLWQSPDGSQVLGILFANWYHNGMEIPVDPEAARAYWKQRLADVERFASTPHFLMMNGCDHQPVQTDLSEALRTARNVYPELIFEHSSYEAYIDQVKHSLPENLAVVRGELRSQRTDGWGTLVNTASARVYIKQNNQHCQTLLEKIAEPLAAFAHLQGRSYPHHLFTYAWKTLMQNHPHDSICGCSVDEVHREMMARFAKSKHVAESLIAESSKVIADHIDTGCFEAHEGALPFVVFNTTGWSRTGVVTVELEVARMPLYAPSPDAIVSELEALSIGQGHIVDPLGRIVDGTIEDLGVRFGFTLPDDKFRQPYMARCIKVTLQANDVPALGFRTYAWLPDAASANPGSVPESASLITGNSSMENEFLAVKIESNGTLTVTDKRSGTTYRDLCAYEDVGDIGNEYMFKQPNGELPLTTHGLQAGIHMAENSPIRAAFEIVHEWELPASADPLLQQEINRMIPIVERRSQRSAETVPFSIKTQVSLEKGAKALKIKTTFLNQAKDHRLRVLFPTDIIASTHYADSIFEAAERSNDPSPEWSNPSNCQHQQAFVALDDQASGLAVANIGLNEYEVLRDGRNTIAVTLLRAVGELGDWGVFPTPEAQCLGESTVEYAIIPYAGHRYRESAAAEAYQFQIPWTLSQTGLHDGQLPSEHAWVQWQGDTIALSAVKINEDTGNLIVRWFNLAHDSAHLSVQVHNAVAWYRSNVLEEKLEQIIANEGGQVEMKINPAEIITVAAVCTSVNGFAFRSLSD